MRIPPNASPSLLTICLAITFAVVSPARAQELKPHGTIGEKPTGDFDCLAFSPDGKTFASAFKGKIQLYDVAQAKLVTEIDAHRADGSHGMVLAFSPDGKLLASAINNLDGKIRLWDTTTYKKIKEFNAGMSHTVAFSPDGKLLATSGNFAEVQLWNVDAGVKGATLVGSKEPALWAGFSPDGKTVASITNSGLTLFDATAAKGHKKLLTLPSQVRFHCAAFSFDGKLLACAGAEKNFNKIEIWDVAASKMITVLTDDAPIQRVSDVNYVFFSPSGKMLAACTNQRATVWQIDAAKIAFVAPKPFASPASRYALSPTARLLAASGKQTPVSLWDLPASFTEPAVANPTAVATTAQPPPTTQPTTHPTTQSATTKPAAPPAGKPRKKKADANTDGLAQTA